MALPAPRAILLSLLLAGGCTLPEGALSGRSPLVGQIHDLRQPRAIERATLTAELARADFVLLGERHDNPEHHRLQAEVVRELQEVWPRPAPVAFEMMDTDQQLAIVLHLRERPGDAAGLEQVLEWRASGWPAWTNYQPIVEAALAADAEIVAANLPPAAVAAVFDGDAGALDPAMVRRTGLRTPLPAPLTAELRRDLQAAHCGDTPPGTVDGMLRVQRARDAVMADRLAALSGRGPGILIAGAEHVRNDRGVPWYLGRIRPGARPLSLAFVEAPPGARELPPDLPYDYVWFTAPLARADPCAGPGEG